MSEIQSSCAEIQSLCAKIRSMCAEINLPVLKYKSWGELYFYRCGHNLGTDEIFHVPALFYFCFFFKFCHLPRTPHPPTLSWHITAKSDPTHTWRQFWEKKQLGSEMDSNCERLDAIMRVESVLFRDTSP